MSDYDEEEETPIQAMFREVMVQGIKSGVQTLMLIHEAIQGTEATREWVERFPGFFTMIEQIADEGVIDSILRIKDHIYAVPEVEKYLPDEEPN